MENQVLENHLHKKSNVIGEEFEYHGRTGFVRSIDNNNGITVCFPDVDEEEFIFIDEVEEQDPMLYEDVQRYMSNQHQTLSAASDGVYKNDSGILYFVKDGKILMSIRGKVFKTSLNHFIGAKHLQPLTGEMINRFDRIYEKAPER